MEIEKKYLIAERGNSHAKDQLWRISKDFTDLKTLEDHVLRKGTKIRQGYLPVDIGKEVGEIIGLEMPFLPGEARLRDAGGRYFLTLKSSGGLVRNETPDKEVSSTLFDLYWPYAKRRIEKVRLEEDYVGFTAEIDVYTDRDLIVAEVEVSSVDIAESLDPLGLDVTENPSYKNRSLAETDFHRKFILTGGPCCGKTATIDYIESLQYPVVPESARQIIDEQQAKGGSLVPWEKFLEFQLEVLDVSLKSERELSEWGTVFLDRGVPDAVAYCVTAGFEPPTPLKDALKQQDYRAVFVLDPLPYKEDDARKENPEQALEIHEGLLEMYTSLGFEPIRVPVNFEASLEDSVRERAHFIVDQSKFLS